MTSGTVAFEMEAETAEGREVEYLIGLDGSLLEEGEDDDEGDGDRGL